MSDRAAQSKPADPRKAFDDALRSMMRQHGTSLASLDERMGNLELTAERIAEAQVRMEAKLDALLEGRAKPADVPHERQPASATP